MGVIGTACLFSKPRWIIAVFSPDRAFHILRDSRPFQRLILCSSETSIAYNFEARKSWNVRSGSASTNLLKFDFSESFIFRIHSGLPMATKGTFARACLELTQKWKGVILVLRIVEWKRDRDRYTYVDMMGWELNQLYLEPICSALVPITLWSWAFRPISHARMNSDIRDQFQNDPTDLFLAFLVFVILWGAICIAWDILQLRQYVGRPQPFFTKQSFYRFS